MSDHPASRSPGQAVMGIANTVRGAGGKKTQSLGSSWIAERMLSYNKECLFETRNQHLRAGLSARKPAGMSVRVAEWFDLCLPRCDLMRSDLI